MTDLITFLRAALDEDEARAQDYEREPHTVACGVRLGYWAEPDCVCGYPARVLADVAAKRAIVDAYVAAGDNPSGEMRTFGYEEGLETAVEHLAQAYGWAGP